MAKTEYTVMGGKYPLTYWQKQANCKSIKVAAQTAMEFMKAGYPIVNIYCRDMKTICAIQEAEDERAD